MLVTGLVASGMMLFLGLIDLGWDIGGPAQPWEYAADVLIIASAAALAMLLVGALLTDAVLIGAAS